MYYLDNRTVENRFPYHLFNGIFLTRENKTLSKQVYQFVKIFFPFIFFFLHTIETYEELFFSLNEAQ